MQGVKTGVWTNYDHDTIHGATLTVTTRNGGFLIAFLALYVSISGGRLWSILAFVIHQARAETPHKTVLHAQQQIVLRNAGDSSSTIVGMLGLIWLQQGSRMSSSFRTAHLILCPLILLLGFSVAGTFSSYVSKAAGSSVLVISDKCGHWGFDFKNANNSILGTASKHAETVLINSDYARGCYGTIPNSKQCRTYVKQKLHYDGFATEVCPFDKTACLLNDTTSFRLDSGVLDSHEDLGINAAAENRIGIRLVTDCAVINSKSFSRFSNTSIFDQNYGVNISLLFEYYEMGPLLAYDPNNHLPPNYTYVASLKTDPFNHDPVGYKLT
jgi:hypothetical protein